MNINTFSGEKQNKNRNHMYTQILSKLASVKMIGEKKKNSNIKFVYTTNLEIFMKICENVCENHNLHENFLTEKQIKTYQNQLLDFKIVCTYVKINK